ncbi:hypothetical protein ALC56_06324 [Trachymyrmex septentrionalis]|uniref:Uncharacterized protein n=1 Tax=Trachymyrmex septentrionalis TaxID=34720 RepID=A0A151JX58_9HYME|nr:hypothetical protein ALC56_06324 [Trachymyrmex septentrionalis]
MYSSRSSRNKDPSGATIRTISSITSNLIQISERMKDENNGAIMTEFVGLRAKMYAVRVEGKKDTKKVKGVKSNVVAQITQITFDDYTRCLNEEIEMTRRQSCIRSKLHEVYTISESKIALSIHTMTNDTSYRIQWRRYRGEIGGYLCNICTYQRLYFYYIFTFFYIFIRRTCIILYLTLCISFYVFLNILVQSTYLLLLCTIIIIIYALCFYVVYKYYYYVLYSIIYYVLLLFFITCIVHLYTYFISVYSKNGKDNKKNILHVYILILL